MKRILILILALLAALSPGLLSLQAPKAPPPVVFGANLPQVGRYSPEADWGVAGGLAGWALKGRAARVPALMWESYPEGFGGGQVDLNQCYRQMEACRGSAFALVLLSPSEWPVTGDWVPPKEHWADALKATRATVAAYDDAAKRYALPPPVYQLWNETSPGKPGGAKEGGPGEFHPRLHAYLAFLTKGLGVKPERLVSPAYSDLTDSPDAALGSLATGSSTDGYWERRVGAIAVHMRAKGTAPDGRPLSPEELETAATGQIDRLIELVSSLPHWRGKGLPVDFTEVYLTPGDLGRPDLNEGDLDAWRQALLRGAARSRARSFLVYGLAPSVIEGGGKWGEYGGWASSLASSRVEAFAAAVRSPPK